MHFSCTAMASPKLSDALPSSYSWEVSVTNIPHTCILCATIYVNPSCSLPYGPTFDNVFVSLRVSCKPPLGHSMLSTTPLSSLTIETHETENSRPPVESEISGCSFHLPSCHGALVKGSSCPSFESGPPRNLETSCMFDIQCVISQVLRNISYGWTDTVTELAQHAQVCEGWPYFPGSDLFSAWRHQMCHYGPMGF